MKLQYEEEFIEAAVFRCANRRPQHVAPQQISRFHHERERLYSILDPDDRNAAFFELHLRSFREWGLERVLLDVVAEIPVLGEQLATLVVRRPRGRDEEGAELYVNDAGLRTGVLAVRPESFELEETLRGTLRHELSHLRDMLDPAFGYSPTIDLPGLRPAQQRLARERYRILWALTIDARWEAQGKPPVASRDAHRERFERSYSFWPADERARVFDRLWCEAAPRHADLLALAADPRDLQHSDRPGPGASCPLCGFPTFDWAPAESLAPQVSARVLSEFPRWTPEQGMCLRCREAYEIAAKLAPAPGPSEA